MPENIRNFKDLKLDLIDNKILFYLSQDLRYSRKKLASELRISPQSLSYRISKLQENLIQPTIILNYPLLDLPSHIFLIPDLREENVKHIVSAPETFLLYKLTSNNQYKLLVISKDIENFIKTYLREYFFEIYPITEYIPDNFNPLRLSFKFKEAIKSDKPYKLNKYDYAVLAELCKNPSLSNFEISKKSGLDWQTVKKRVELLTQHDIIKKIRYVIDVEKWGFYYYLIKIKVKPRNMDKFLILIDKNDYSGFRFKSFNHIFIHYLAPSPIELGNFIEEIRKEDPSLDIESMQISKDLKTNPVPEAVLEYFREKSK